MQKPRSILLFLSDLGFGGLERVTLNLTAGLSESGYGVTLAVRRRGGEFVGFVSPDVDAVQFRYGTRLYSLLKMTRLIRERRPDVLIANGPEALIAVLARFFSGSSAKILITQHGPFLKGVMPPFRRLKMWVYRYAFAKADGFIGVSNGVAEDIRRNFGAKTKPVWMIYNPIIGAPCYSKHEHVSHPFFREGVPVFVGVGRFVEQKGFNTLLESFAIYRRKMEGRLILVGDGPLRAALEKQCAALNLQDCVDFVGYVPDPSIYMRPATALVCPSIYAGLETVLVEALAAQTPVISTDCDYGSAELLENGRFGTLATVGDAGGIASLMEAMAKGEINTSAMLEDFTRSRAADFQLEVASRRYAAVLEALFA